MLESPAQRIAAKFPAHAGAPGDEMMSREVDAKQIQKIERAVLHDCQRFAMTVTDLKQWKGPTSLNVARAPKIVNDSTNTQQILAAYN